MRRSEQEKEDWLNSKWRPTMGWMYMAVCIFDFMLAPILWSMVQAYQGGQVNIQWQPLTLQGAGLFHVAMGAVLGLAAYGRTQEKINGVAFLPNSGTTYVPPVATASEPEPLRTTVTKTYSEPQELLVFKNGRKGPVQPDFPEI